MTRAERFLAILGIAVIACAVLIIAYARQSIPANAQATSCVAQRKKAAQAFDQIKFSRSAEKAVAAAVGYSNASLDSYLKTISTLRYELAARRTPSQKQSNAQSQLAQASWILIGQEEPLAQARSIVAQDERELAAAVPFVNAAGRDMNDQDCAALSRTLAKSGWPKDKPFAQLALAAHLNSEASNNLESALNLILRAQRAVRIHSARH